VDERGQYERDRQHGNEDRRLRSDPLNLAGHARWRESVISANIAVSKQRPKTVIVGAGVIGLGIAWRLAQAGCAVTVYDRGEAGHGASWAAAGMLAAAVETEPGEEALLELTLESQRLWPDFARELEAAAGVSVEYRDHGTMVVALNRDDAALIPWQLHPCLHGQMYPLPRCPIHPWSDPFP